MKDRSSNSSELLYGLDDTLNTLFPRNTELINVSKTVSVSVDTILYNIWSDYNNYNVGSSYIDVLVLHIRFTDIQFMHFFQF